jgi:hypothetical protein
VKAAVSKRAAAAALLGCFAVLHVQDTFAGKDWNVFTLVFVGLFLAFVFFGLASRREGEDAAAGPSRLAGILGRLLAAAVCGACIVFHLYARVHTAWTVTIFLGGALAVLLVLAFLRGGPTRGFFAAAACVLLVLVATPQAYQGMPFFHLRSNAFQITVLASFGLLALCAALDLGGRFVLPVVLVAGVALRVIGMRQWPINGFLRDMLPLIESAAATLLDGRDPYRLHFLSHDVALTYLPVMWLSYLPVYAAKIDIRWANVLFFVVSAVLVCGWGGRGPLPGAGPLRAWADRILPARPHPVLLLAAVMLSLQSEMLWNGIHGEPPAYWLWLVLFLTFVVRAKIPAAAVLLGVVIATRHFGLLLVPFFLLWLRVSGVSRRDTLAWSLVVGAVASVLIVPWMMLNADAFIYGTVEWLLKYGAAYAPGWKFQVGFTSWFYDVGLEKWLPAVQWAAYAGVFAATAAAAVRRARRGREDAAAIAWLGCAVAYLLFVAFGNMVWKSFYMSVMIVPLAGLALARVPSTAPLLEGRRRLAWALVAALAAVNVLSGALVARALVRWKDRGDIVDFARQAAKKLKPDDLLVDYSYLNAWHVFQGSAFSGAGPGPLAMYTIMPRNQELARFGRIVVFDGYGLHGLEEFPDLIEAWSVQRETSGRSALTVFTLKTPYAEAWRLSRNITAMTEVKLASDKPPTIVATLHGDKFLFPGIDPWIWVGSYTCVAAGTNRPSIFAQLLEGKKLEARVALPQPGDLWLFAMADDRALVRALEPLEIEVVAKNLRKTIEQPARRGIFSWRIGSVPAGDIEIRVEGKPPGLMNLCFDLVLSKFP